MIESFVSVCHTSEITMRARSSYRRLFLPPIQLVGLTLLLVTATGCSRQPIPVNGTVTLDGKPVEEADVTFHPFENDRNAKVAVGKTDPTGTFHLKTGEVVGAEPRDYKVVIIKNVLADPKLKLPNFPDNLEGRNQMQDWLARHFPNTSPFKNLLPAKYADPKTTPLTWKVPGNATDKLELTSK
jgi:hypothetical protein